MTQLKNISIRIPTWFGLFLGWVLTAIIDITFGLGNARSPIWPWLIYGLSPLALLIFYSCLQESDKPKGNSETLSNSFNTYDSIYHNIRILSDEDIIKWLLDQKAQHQNDFLDRGAIVKKITSLVKQDIKSVGIIGQFGAGKTSIVKWISSEFDLNIDKSDPQYFVSYFSCWGFETAGAAIKQILEDSISKTSEHVDTFDLNTLPESYRDMFSDSNGLLQGIWKSILRNVDYQEQFKSLSNLLEKMNKKLIYIIEDLDRNETRTFDTQEILAFLNRLKDYNSFSFILTGGMSLTRRIDYAKLCNHIEYVHPPLLSNVCNIVSRVSHICLNTDRFKYHNHQETTLDFEYKEINHLMLAYHGIDDLPVAISKLLVLPRTMRQALSSTYNIWKRMPGEIDYNHLLVLNVLRYGAPECYQFLIENWDVMVTCPSRQNRLNVDESKQGRIQNSWKLVVESVAWNEAAARQLILYILPYSNYWLNDSSVNVPKSGYQRINEQRYWNRATLGFCGENDIKDQDVITDTLDWQSKCDRSDTSSKQSRLIINLTTNPDYSNVWESLYTNHYSFNNDKILMLFDQVIDEILRENGATACANSTGFVQLWRFAMGSLTSSEDYNLWLIRQITKASQISIQMAVDLRDNSIISDNSIVLNQTHIETICRHIYTELKNCIKDSSILFATLARTNKDTISKLVFGTTSADVKKYVKPLEWAWLGPIILDEMRKKDIYASVICVNLITRDCITSEVTAGTLEDTMIKPWEKVTVDIDILNLFFADSILEVIEILESMIDLMPAEIQPLVEVIRKQVQVQLEQ
jgi:hypothetical protein